MITSFQIEIENSIISDYEFSDTSVVEISIPGNVKAIGEGAFARCKSLKTVIIQSGVEEICYAAFQDSHGIENITIPNTMKKFDDAIPDYHEESCALKNIYYNGTLSDWEKMEVNASVKVNICGTNTTIHMRDGTTYTYDGNDQLVQK